MKHVVGKFWSAPNHTWLRVMIFSVVSDLKIIKLGYMQRAYVWQFEFLILNAHLLERFVSSVLFAPDYSAFVASELGAFALEFAAIDLDRLKQRRKEALTLCARAPHIFSCLYGFEYGFVHIPNMVFFIDHILCNLTISSRDRGLKKINQGKIKFKNVNKKPVLQIFVI